MALATTSSRKRDHLMATAARLFYRDGYRAVGIDTILAEAGVAKMTLYNHFASKDELILAILEQRDRELRASLGAHLASVSGTAADKLLSVFDWLESWFGAPDFNGCSFIRALSEYPDAAHPIHQMAWQPKVALREVLADLGAQAGAKNPSELGVALGLVIDGAIVAAQATGTTSPARSARDAAAALLRLAVAKAGS